MNKGIPHGRLEKIPAQSRLVSLLLLSHMHFETYQMLKPIIIGLEVPTTPLELNDITPAVLLKPIIIGVENST